jgi:hypothetical protein
VVEIVSWAGSIDLDAPAIRLLTGLIDQLPADASVQITLFGSAPIQIVVDSSLTSADVDLFSDHEDLGRLVEQAGLSQEDAEFYIQVCSELNFRTSPRWRGRTQSVQIRNCTVVIPHPIDILIAKLNRLEEKDLEAFRVVRRKTGHPTEEELIHELRLAVDLFRPDFDEENGHDIANNCRRLWPLIYGREIDPRQEIIVPALKTRREGYGEPTRDYKRELRESVAAYGKLPA